MTKLSKHAQMFKLVFSFIDHHPETELAQEWRELTTNGVVRAFELALPVEKMEPKLDDNAKWELAIIKPLLGLA